MDTFAALHGQHWESPRFGTDLSWVTPLSHRVGFKALAWQFRKMRVSLTRTFRPVAPRRGAPHVRVRESARR